MTELTKEKYDKLFENNEKNALERAWLNRDFEITHYWKRATYFWTFIALAFAGYFTLVGTSNYDIVQKRFPQLELVLICLGFVFSLAWLLANFGSKKWQKNWEKHIVELEDSQTGPLYKTVYNKRSYSVSKINIRVNFVVIFIWLLLGGNFLTNNYEFGISDIDYFTTFCVGITALFSIDMIFWGGKSNSKYFKKREPFFNDYKCKNYMKENVKILASRKTDAMEGWAWICPTLITENGFYKIINKSTKKEVTCYLRIIDDNYISEYKTGNTLTLKKDDKSIVLNEFYRKKIGVENTNTKFSLEIKKAGWYFEYLSFEFSHPNPYVRQSSRLTLISFCIGIIALGLTLLTIIR